MACWLVCRDGSVVQRMLDSDVERGRWKVEGLQTQHELAVFKSLDPKNTGQVDRELHSLILTSAEHPSID